MSSKIVSLETSSYAGICPGAIHYYGYLQLFSNNDLEKITLNRVLDKESAAKLNKFKERGFYREGDETERFDSESQVIECAINCWKDFFSEGDILVLNKGCSVDPCKILYAEEPFMTEGNRLFEEAEFIGFWDYQEEKMQKIVDEWDKLFK
jgi:hypothetical protein